MQEFLFVILNQWRVLALWALGFFLVFSTLARFVPCNAGQPLWRKDALTDILYFFIMPIINRPVHAVFLTAGLFLVFYGQPREEIHQYMLHGYGLPAKLPLWGQAAIIFLVSDFLLYWTHRMFHEKALWRFHAIHHSSPHVDWLSTWRFHPVNVWLSFTLVDVSMLLVGFSPAAVSLLAGFNIIYSAMVHANLNWTFGPFKYVFASPVFHRWHHTTRQEGMDKNFAPTFPLLDMIFGTFYMPEGRLPEQYGVTGSAVPDSFVRQIVWPFSKAAPR